MAVMDSVSGPGQARQIAVCIECIHGSPGTEITGTGTEIGVFGHVCRYFYRIGTGDCDFQSTGLELVLVLVDCDCLSTGLYRSRELIILAMSASH